MKNISKTFLFTLFTLFILASALTASVAWFEAISVSSTGYIYGSSEGAYFAYGNGKKLYDPEDPTTQPGDRPFGIANTRHLNNLAWLQYMGTFNQGEHVYFELANDINENGSTYVIPPIGTEDNPFVGVFDGKGHTINNIKVTNDVTAFSKKPTDSESFSYNQDDAQVVGLFGVVKDNTEGVNSLEDFTLKDITVESKSSQTLIGLAAGYVDSEISNVIIDGKATIDVNTQTCTPKTTICGNNSGITKLSNYGLVGYTTKEGSNGDFYKKISEYYHNGGGTGTSPGWSGTIDTKKYMNWMYYLSQNNGYDGGNGFIEYNTGNNEGIYTKDGMKIDITVLKTAGNPFPTSYIFKYNDSYKVTINQDKTGVLVYNNTSYNFTWSDTYRDSTSGSTKYRYFGYQFTFSNSITLNGKSSNTFYFFHTSGPQGSTIPTNTNTGYLASYKLYSNKTGTQVDSKQYTIQYQYTTYRGLEGTCIPLNFTSKTWNTQIDNTVSSSNTGYIVGADGPTAVNGAVKLNSFSVNFLTNSFNDSTATTQEIVEGYKRDTTFDEETAEIITYSDTEDDWVLINDDDNSEHTVLNTTINGYTKDATTTPDELFIMPSKYTSSKTSLKNDTLNNSLTFSGIKVDPIKSGYGINEANNIKSFTKVKRLDFEGEKTLEMPMGCIDFYIKDQGVINFFAGTCATVVQDMSFFSLYEIKRNQDDTINSVTEIRRIYENPDASTNKTKPYIYSYSASKPGTAGDLVKDLDKSLRVSTAPVRNALYYFELPVNPGEYAISALSGSSNSGACMLYLDLAANGTNKEKVTANTVTTIQSTNTFPLGVDFALTGVTGDGGNGFCVDLKSGKKGYIDFNIVPNKVTIGGTTEVVDEVTYSIAAYTYKSGNFGSTYTVSGNSPGPLISPPTNGVRVLTINIGKLDGVTNYVVRITDTLTNASGGYNNAQSIYEYKTGSGDFIPVPGADASAKENYITTTLSTEVNLTTLRGLSNAATLTRSTGSGVFDVTYNELTYDPTAHKIDIHIDITDATITITPDKYDETHYYTVYIDGNPYVSPYPAS